MYIIEICVEEIHYIQQNLKYQYFFDTYLDFIQNAIIRKPLNLLSNEPILHTNRLLVGVDGQYTTKQPQISDGSQKLTHYNKCFENIYRVLTSVL